MVAGVVSPAGDVVPDCTGRVDPPPQVGLRLGLNRVRSIQVWTRAGLVGEAVLPSLLASQSAEPRQRSLLVPRLRGRVGRSRAWNLCFLSSRLERRRLCWRSRGTIDRDHARINVAYLPVFGLDPGEKEPVYKDREALSARHGGDYIGTLPWLRENLRAICIFGAVDVPHVVCPSR
jgi:hypothetical protein